MIIRQVRLERFGCHDWLDLSFQPGLNIVRGPNGSGKSTLQRALLKLLFDKPSKTVTNAKECTWGADQLYRLAMRFEVDSHGMCQLSKDFETNECRLVLGTGEELTQYRAVDAALARLVGTPSPKLFRSTLFVAQQELAKLGAEKEINTSLEERVTGGEDDTSTQKVLDRLQKEIDAYGKGYGPNVRANVRLGVVAQTQKEIDEVDARITRLRSELDAQMRDLAERDQVEYDLGECRKELKPKQDLLANLEKVNHLREQLRAAEADEQRLEQQIDAIETAQAALAEAQQAVSRLKPVSDVDEAQHQTLLELHNRLGFLRNEPVPSPPEDSSQARPQRPVPAIVLVVLGLLGLFGGVVLFRRVDPFVVLVTFAASLLLLIGGALWWLVHAIRQRQQVRRRQQQHDAVAAAQRQREHTLAQAARELDEALGRLGCTSWSDYQTQYEAARNAHSDEKVASAQLKALLSRGHNLAALEEERRVYSRRRRDAQEALEDPGFIAASRVTAVEHQQLLANVNRLEEKMKELERNYHVLTGRLESQTVSHSDLSGAEEKRVALIQRHERAKELLAVYQQTHEALNLARERTIQRVRHDLQFSSCQHFARLTLGQFDTAIIDQELKVTVTVPDHADLQITDGDLSCGTKDQLYFAVRLALIDNLWNGTVPPLFLDDPFVTFDPDRQQAAIQICREIAQTRQVFLFTCTSQYDRWGHVVELEPTWAGAVEHA